MQFRYETWEEKDRRLRTPHLHFCLFPRFYQGRIFWLETVWRWRYTSDRLVFDGIGASYPDKWHYESQ